jgi:competence protein ComEA
MPTPAERKALLFLAGVIVLGASVRVVRAARDDGASDSANARALAGQLAAVDSAHRADTRTPRPVKGSSRSLRRRGPARSGGSSFSETSTPSSTTSSRTGSTGEAPPAIVDLDAATASEIESLPRIGEVLARRIVDDRSQNGPFGSLEGFQRVRGVGPALAKLLADRVTFSGTARPSNAVADPRLRSSSTPSKSSRRERHK